MEVILGLCVVLTLIILAIEIQTAFFPDVRVAPKTFYKTKVDTFINGIVEVESEYELCQVTKQELIDMFENKDYRRVYFNKEYFGHVQRFVYAVLGVKYKFSVNDIYQLPENVIYNTLKEVYEHIKLEELNTTTKKMVYLPEEG